MVSVEWSVSMMRAAQRMIPSGRFVLMDAGASLLHHPSRCQHLPLRANDPKAHPRQQAAQVGFCGQIAVAQCLAVYASPRHIGHFQHTSSLHRAGEQDLPRVGDWIRQGQHLAGRIRLKCTHRQHLHGAAEGVATVRHALYSPGAGKVCCGLNT